jgi:hypothetical protein
MDAVKMMADERSVVSYRPRFNKHTGSVLATILLQQATYWWCKMGEQPYYKFKEPCAAGKYKAGESWCEELGFSRREFDTACALLEDRGFLNKKTDMARLTWYSVNAEKISEMMDLVYESSKGAISQYVKAESAFTIGGKRLLTIQETTHKTTTDNAAPNVADTPKKPKFDEAQFDQFWAVWPKRTAKEDAKKAWAKIKMTDDLLAMILKAVNAQKLTWDNPKYIKNPATWINGKCWEDETIVPNQTAFKPACVAVPPDKMAHHTQRADASAIAKLRDQLQ